MAGTGAVDVHSPIGADFRTVGTKDVGQDEEDEEDDDDDESLLDGFRRGLEPDEGADGCCGEGCDL